MGHYTVRNRNHLTFILNLYGLSIAYHLFVQSYRIGMPQTVQCDRHLAPGVCRNTSGSSDLLKQTEPPHHHPSLGSTGGRNPDPTAHYSTE